MIFILLKQFLIILTQSIILMIQEFMLVAILRVQFLHMSWHVDSAMLLQASQLLQGVCLPTTTEGNLALVIVHHRIPRQFF